MAVVIKILGRAIPHGWTESPESGRFVRRFDPDAHGGRGSETLVDEPGLAKRFPDVAAAAAFWRTQSRVAPLRPDGEPNRPLTAYSIELLTVD